MLELSLVNQLRLQILERAFLTYGEKESPGSKRNGIIGQMIDRWFRKGADDSLTAWCGIWMSDTVDKAGLVPPANPFRAKQWAEWGTEIMTARPGSIVVMTRGSGLYHVTVAVRYSEDGRYLLCIGGNQGNSVNITAYDVAKIESIREATEAQMKAVESSR